MKYKAECQKPYLNQFTQPDSIVPDPYNSQDWDRYSYVRNNPVRYNDPTGHVCSDPEDPNGSCEGGGGTVSSNYAANWLRSFLNDRYDWNIASDFTEDELKVIRQTAYDIESYVDGLTGGAGLEWMNAYLGGTTIEHWSGDYNQTLPGWVPGVGENTISLVKGRYDAHWFAHELGHIWDINSGRGICACGVTGGIADSLNTFIGGSIASTRSDRYTNYPGNPNIKSADILGMIELVRFDQGVAGGYGNGSTADYLAESFSWNVIDRQNVPIAASMWVDYAIIAQAASLP